MHADFEERCSLRLCYSELGLAGGPACTIHLDFSRPLLYPYTSRVRRKLRSYLFLKHCILVLVEPPHLPLH